MNSSTPPGASTRQLALDFTSCYWFSPYHIRFACRNLICQHWSITETTVKKRLLASILFNPQASTGPLSAIQTGTVGFEVHCAHARPPGTIAADFSRLSSATPGHHRGLRDPTLYGDKDLDQIMVVQPGLDQANIWTIGFWFEIFGLSRNALFNVCSNFNTDVNGMQDSSISTKTWSCKEIFNSLAPWQNGHNPGH